MKELKEKHLVKSWVLIILVIILVMAFISLISPSPIGSQSIVDLAVNNTVNIGIAVIISLFAIQNYESKRQRTTYIVDLIKHIDDICDDMVDMIMNHDLQKNELIFSLYATYTKALAEYIDATDSQVITSNKSLEVKSVLMEMKRIASEHINSVNNFFLRSSSDSVSTDDDYAQDFKVHALQDVLAIQTFVPKLLGAMKY